MLLSPETRALSQREVLFGRVNVELTEREESKCSTNERKRKKKKTALELSTKQRVPWDSLLTTLFEHSFILSPVLSLTN